MKLSLLTWNSTSINSSTLKAYIPPGQMANLSSNAVTVNRAFDFPFLSTTVLNPHVFIIGVYVAAGQSINTNRELLKQYFNITDQQRHNLIANGINEVLELFAPFLALFGVDVGAGGGTIGVSGTSTFGTTSTGAAS